MPQSKVLSFAIYATMILLAGFFTLFVHQTPVEAAITPPDTPCHLYNSSVPIPNPFGTAYNLFSSTGEQLLSAGCSSDTMVEVIAGNGEPNTYVYNKGYYLYGSEWREFTMSCTDGNLLVNAWCVGSAETSIPAAPTADGRGYFVGYTCQWIDNAWKCGCQDAACNTPQWQLQSYTDTTTVLATGESTDDAGTNYYVKPDGNDNAAGTSHATAWRTVAKVNSFRFNTGDDVYFLSGGTWTDANLTVDWSGTSANKAIVGAYYWNGSTEVTGVSGVRPTIDGGNKLPTDTYRGLIQVNTPYVTVENIIVQASNGECIDYDGNGLADNGLVRNVLVQDCWRRGVNFHQVDNGILEFSEVTNTDNFGNGAMVLSQRSNNTIIRYNRIHSSAGWSEGINALHSDNMQIIGNVIYDTWAAGIYLDHGVGTKVKYNIIYYTTNKTYWRFANKPSFGILIADEVAQGPTHLSSDQVIMYNYVAATGANLKLNSNATTRSALINAKVIGNTFVEANSTDGTAIAIDIQASPRHSNSIFKNNIILQTRGTIAAVPNTTGIDFDNNLWSQQPEIDARGPNDPPYADPMLSKSTGWTSLSANRLSGPEFNLRAGSPAIDAGQNLGATYEDVPDAGQSNWPTNIVLKTQSLWEIGADSY